jgi:nicotinamidase-related amidase
MDAIIIVDLQKAFPIPPALVQRIDERAKTFSRRIFTQFINEPGSLFRTKLKRSACPPGAEETALALQPNANDWVIPKPRYSLAPRDVERIAAAGIRKALVCGVDTDACVLGVTFSLFDAGIDCEVDPDLCWSSTGLHEPALKIIQEQFGTGKR